MPATSADLFARYLGADWIDRHDDPALWDGVLAIPDEELWSVRQALRRYLFTFIRERARQRWVEEHVGIPRVVAAGTLLEPEALTLGFARRFTGYKRPELVFHDPERLARILNAAGRPVQIIFAGKSHPADDIGKHHLQRVYKRALDPQFGGRIAFVDDYDLHVAHFLVQGCDVWLNNPRKPLEASGTSGMKAAINGVPHLSIGDGWWAEGFTGANGWVIDGGAPPDNPDAVDAADADALYRLLEEEVVPAFYDRDRADVPHRWMATIKEAIRTRGAAVLGAAHGQGIRAADVRAGAWNGRRRKLEVRSYNQRYATQDGRQVAVRAVRRQGRLGAARRREVLPRLLGQEDRRRRDRRPRVRAQALHPRPERREIPDLSLHAEAARAAS